MYLARDISRVRNEKMIIDQGNRLSGVNWSIALSSFSPFDESANRYLRQPADSPIPAFDYSDRPYIHVLNMSDVIVIGAKLI